MKAEYLKIYNIYAVTLDLIVNLVQYRNMQLELSLYVIPHTYQPISSSLSSGIYPLDKLYLIYSELNPGSCRPPAASYLQRVKCWEKPSAAALQEDKHTHYFVSSIKQLQLNHPLDRLISERSWWERGPRWRERLLLLSPIISSERKKVKKNPNRHSERDSPSH